MAEYLVQDTSLISIGDKVRALSGVEGSMSLNTMRDKIEAASNEVVTQSGLINQVKETLLEKIDANAIISTATITPTSNSTSINFTGVTDTPVYFCVAPIGNTALSSSSRYAINVVYDGNATVGIYSNRTTATYTTNGYSWTYSNGTLNVKSASTSNGGYFKSGTSYQLTYVTLPSITTDATYSSSISPSSNSTSISFSGLTSEPKYFAIIPTSNTTLSSSTRYALNVVYDGVNTIGVYSNNSTATYTTNGFSWTYSNGTLTVKTASTSNGGYFRSGAEHKLIYVAAKSGSGNGTVSIENNTDGLQDIIQLMDNLPESQGGAELNFEIVGGTTQPSNPAENMIWVNTNIDISSWSFAVDQPTELEEGMVWFKTATSSGAEFNALKNNSLQVYVVTAKQCVDGALVNVDVCIYKDGTWAAFGVFLFNYGTQTYNWTASSLVSYISSNNVSVTPGVSTNDDGSITLYVNRGGYNFGSGIYRVYDAIDLANFKTLNISTEVSGLATWFLTVYPTNADAWGDDTSRGGDTVAILGLASGSYTGILDISSLTGEYYVGVGGLSGYSDGGYCKLNTLYMN